MRLNLRSACVSPRRMAFNAAMSAGLFLAAALCAGADPDSGSPSFQKLAQDYFSEQTVQFARDLLLKEEYLNILYEGGAKEIKYRRKEALDLNSLWSPLWRQESVPPDLADGSFTGADIPERFHAWRNFEEQEYQRNFELIQQVRSQLMSLGTSQQKERMFRRDLFSAFRYYGRGDYELAQLLFDRLIEDYGYQSIDDVLYYQGQTYKQLYQFDAALQQFRRLLSTCPNSAFRIQAYDQASAILDLFGRNREMQALYNDYVNEGAPGIAESAGAIHIRAARAEAALQHFKVAVEILDRVPQACQYYFSARYLQADCLVALEDWRRAQEALAGLAKIKRNGLPYERWRMLLDEAQIRLAYIHYQQGDLDRAAEAFGNVRQGSELYDRALMGKAWIAYQLDQYPAAIAKSEQLLRRYPYSPDIYEASSLAGYCYEQMGDKKAATASFLEVLQAGAGRSDLETFLEERRRISETLAAMKVLEEQVFSSGNPEQFAEYKRARDLLWICQQRIGLAEMLQVNSRMTALFQERAALHALLRENRGLQPDITESKRTKLMGDFRQIEERILAGLGRLKDLAQDQMLAAPLYFQEAQIAFLNTRADSLSRHLEKEIDRLTAVVAETDSIKAQALKNGDLQTALDMGMRMQSLNTSLGQTDENRTRVSAYQHPKLLTRVEYWSDFSFCRYAMDGLGMEELERKWERLQEVEEYLATLDELMEQRGIGEPAAVDPAQP